MRARTHIAVLVTGLVLAIAACSTDSGGTASGGGAGAKRPNASADGGAKALGSAGGERGQSATRSRVTLQPAVILTGDLTVQARRGAAIDDVADAAIRRVTGLGGQSVGDQRSHEGSESSADLVFKVPPAKFSAALDDLANLGKEIKRSAQQQDVTDEVVDVGSRVRTQQASIERVRKLLGSARTIGEVVQVEGELARREADLESLQARQRALDQQTSAATINLHLRSPDATAAPTRPTRGFIAGLRAGWTAFTKSVTVVLTITGALLPFLVVALALAAAVLAVARRRRTERPAAPAPSTTP